MDTDTYAIMCGIIVKGVRAIVEAKRKSWYLYIVRFYSCHALIARYVRDFANILRFSRFLRFATILALLKLRNFYITLLLITNGATVENGPHLKYIKLGQLALQSALGRNIITKTCLYNFDPLKPHFYIVKLGFTWVYIIFLFLLKT